MNKKKVIMFLLYLVVICNIIGMLVYFYKGFKEEPPSFVSIEVVK